MFLDIFIESEVVEKRIICSFVVARGIMFGAPAGNLC